MTKRNDLNDAGNSAHQPTHNPFTPLRGRVMGAVSLLVLQLVTCAPLASGLCTHMVFKVCASYCLESIIHMHIHNMIPNASQLFLQGPMLKRAIHSKIAGKNRVGCGLLSGKGLKEQS